MIELKALNYEEAFKYMGYGDASADSQIISIMKECEKEILKNCKPSFCYRVYDLVRENESIRLPGCTLKLVGESIKKHLEGCDRVVVMAATAGAGIDGLITRAQLRSVAYGMVMDTMASVCIEQICDEAMAEIREALPDYGQTWRFSPGYGDLPLELQKDLLEAVEARKRIGLGITNSDMLTPVKSVTAFIGLFDKRKITEENSRKVRCTDKEACMKCTRRKVCNISPYKEI